MIATEILISEIGLPIVEFSQFLNDSTKDDVLNYFHNKNKHYNFLTREIDTGDLFSDGVRVDGIQEKKIIIVSEKKIQEEYKKFNVIKINLIRGEMDSFKVWKERDDFKSLCNRLINAISDFNEDVDIDYGNNIEFDVAVIKTEYSIDFIKW